METLRGFADDRPLGEYIDEDDVDDANGSGLEMPPQIGTSERRMQVRAYNFWASLLDEHPYPSIEDLEPEKAGDFGEFGVLLDFTTGVENPAIAYLGQALRDECGMEEDVAFLSQVPARSLLSRITDHYMQIIANEVPIGFEAEFVNERGITILYRGILLPFSSDGSTLDFVFGVINWKEGAEKSVVDEIELELTAQYAEQAARGADNEPVEEMDVEMPRPAFGLNIGNTALVPAGPAHGEVDAAPTTDIDDDAHLADWLASARDMAAHAGQLAERGRRALYDAIGRAYDFSIMAERFPDDYSALLEDSGIAVQDRAPYTPVAKLVFGIDYDKTRLTEIAAAIGYAHEHAIDRGSLGDYLASHDGGLKGLVAQIRAERKAGDSKPKVAPDLAIRDQLRGAPSRELDEFTGGGSEFLMLMARRRADGRIELIGEIEGDASFTEKALRQTRL